MCDTVLEQQITVIVNGLALFRANQEWSNLFSDNRLGIRESIRIQQTNQPQKRLSFAIMRCCRQQQQIWTCLCKQIAQLVTSHFAGRTSHSMRLIYNNQIPSTIDDGIDSFLIVLFNLFLAPTSVFFNRLDGIHRGNHLIELTIHIVIIRQTANRIIIGWQNHLKFLVKLFLHLACPVGHQTSRANHQNPTDKTTALQFSDNHTSFNRLTKTNFIRQNIANVVGLHCAVQHMELVRQRNNPAGKRRKETTGSFVFDFREQRNIAQIIFIVLHRTAR